VEGVLGVALGREVVDQVIPPGGVMVGRVPVLVGDGQDVVGVPALVGLGRLVGRRVVGGVVVGRVARDAAGGQSRRVAAVVVAGRVAASELGTLGPDLAADLGEVGVGGLGSGVGGRGRVR
jgi:hypothetical protein